MQRKGTQGFQQEDPQVQHPVGSESVVWRLVCNTWIFSGGDGDSFSPGEEPVLDPDLHEDGGSNLVDSRPSVLIREPVLLDLSRDPVVTGLFESYTATGTILKKLLDPQFLSLTICLDL